MQVDNEINFFLFILAGPTVMKDKSGPSFLDLAANRFLLTFGEQEQTVNLVYVNVFALIICNFFYYAEKPSFSPLLAEGEEFAFVSSRVAMRNAFAFGMTGFIASLIANDQALFIVLAKTLSWAALGWVLTSRRRWLALVVSMLIAVTASAAIMRAWQGTWSDFSLFPVSVMTIAAAVTGRALWLNPASSSPILLLVGACICSFLFLIYSGMEIAKLFPVLLTDAPLTEFVRKLREEVKDPKVRALLNAGLADGRLGDDRISVSQRLVRAGDLLPTQTQIDLDKSVGYYLGKNPDETDLLPLVKSNLAGGAPKSNAPRITVANAGGKLYVIDGHHRWSQQFIFGGAETLLACDIIEAADYGVDDPVKILKIVQVAIAASTGKVPAAKVNTANDVFAMDEKAIREYFEAPVSGPFPNKAWATSYARLAEIVPGGNTVQWLVSQTLPVRAKKQALGDLPREAMPQLEEDGTAQDKLWRLAQGRVNWVAPF
jgi:hypothetical protein